MERFRKTQAVVFHEKGKNVAAFMASETIKNPFRGSNDERRGFFLMKRAKAFEALARGLERDMTADDVGDVYPRADFLFRVVELKFFIEIHYRLSHRPKFGMQGIGRK